MRRMHSYRSNAHRSRRLCRAALGAAVLSLVAASDASAQFAYGYMRAYPGPAYDDVPPISPRAVVYRLQDRGFSGITRPRYDGRAYIVEATNPAGDRVRLFVDAREGGVIGRERLDMPYYPSGRVARAAPGYGWTEEDMASRRTRRDPEALVPPGDIPLPRPSLHAEIERAPNLPSRPGAAEAGTFGTNPDARGGTADKARGSAPQRKTAKLTPPAKPAAPGMVPEAPRPQATPAAAKASEPPKPAADSAKAESAKIESAPLTPAANQPAAAETPAAPQAAEPPVAEKPSEAKRADKAATGKDGAGQGWQDPPASEAKRNVRVIGGAIVVPGGEAPPAAAN